LTVSTGSSAKLFTVFTGAIADAFRGVEEDLTLRDLVELGEGLDLLGADGELRRTALLKAAERAVDRE
jgi:hypothetical protein